MEIKPPAIVISVAVDGNIVRVNRPAVDFFEYAAEELLGRSIGLLFLDCDQPTALQSTDQQLPFPLYLESISTMARCRSGRTVDVNVAVSEQLSSTAVEYVLLIFPLELQPSRFISSSPISAEELQRRNYLRSELFNSIYEHSAVGIAVCDLAGRYISANSAMCKFIGYSEDELRTRTFMDITYAEDIAGNVDMRSILLKGDCDAFQLEKRYVHKSGRVIWALMVVSPVHDESGQPIYTVGQMLNIDELKQTELALRRSRESLANSQKIAQVGDWEWFAFEDVISVSAEFRRIFDLKQETPEIGARFLVSKIHPDDQQLLNNFVDRFSAEGNPCSADFRIVLDDGAEKFVHMIAEIVSYDTEGRPIQVVGTVQDISERKAYEKTIVDYQEQVRNLAAHSNLMVESERKRIARDVHDEIGQLLTVLKIDMQLCKKSIPDNPLIQQKSADMLALIDRATTAVRDVTHNLRPPALDIGLIPAIEWLVQDVSRRASLRFLLNVDPIDDHLEDEVATAIFRVTQESITNIIRHAAAAEVTITLTQTDSLLKLQIKDNGQGFVVNRINPVWGFGLLGMSERIISLGGFFDVASELNVGTTVNIEVPLRA